MTKEEEKKVNRHYFMALMILIVILVGVVVVCTFCTPENPAFSGTPNTEFQINRDTGTDIIPMEIEF